MEEEVSITKGYKYLLPRHFRQVSTLFFVDFHWLDQWFSTGCHLRFGRVLQAITHYSLVQEKECCDVILNYKLQCLLHISVFLNLCSAKDFGKKLCRDVKYCAFYT